jgi:hypothetical protein
MPFRGWLTALAALAGFAVPRAASADGAIILFPGEGSVGRLTLPALSLNGSDVSRRIVGLPVRSDATMLSVGGGVQMFVTKELEPDKLSIGPFATLLNVRYGSSSPAPAVAAEASGAPVSVVRGPLNVLEIGFPGLSGGVFATYGRFKVQAGIDFGIGTAWSSASVDGAAAGSVDGGWRLYARVPVAACVLARPMTSEGGFGRTGQGVCATFAANVFEEGWFTGWSVGLRVDL